MDSSGRRLRSHPSVWFVPDARSLPRRTASDLQAKVFQLLFSVPASSATLDTDGGNPLSVRKETLPRKAEFAASPTNRGYRGIAGFFRATVEMRTRAEGVAVLNGECMSICGPRPCFFGTRRSRVVDPQCIHINARAGPTAGISERRIRSSLWVHGGALADHTTTLG